MAVGLVSFTLDSAPGTYSASKNVTISWSTGDVIVVGITAYNGDTNVSSVTATGLTFTQQQNTLGDAGTADAIIYTAVASGSGTSQAVTVSVTGSTDPYAVGVWVFNGASGVGSSNSFKGIVDGQTASLSLTPAAGDAVAMIEADWLTTTEGTLTGGSGTITERAGAITGSGIYLFGDWIGASAGAATFGCSSYASRRICSAAVIITASAGVTRTQSAFRFGVDDGSESAHTWAAAENTNVTDVLGSKLVRAQVNAAGDPAATAYTLRYQKNGAGGYVAVPVGSTTVPTLSYGATGATAVSAVGGTSVSPSYPTGITTLSELILVIGMKPSTANSGSVTTPSGWTLRGSLTGAGGYGATLAADTGNTNVWVFTKDTVTGSESGSLAVTIATNDVSWANITRLEKAAAGTMSWEVGTGSDTSAGSVSIATGAMNIAAGDYIIAGMVIPTDVTTPSQFSAEALSQTGTTFGTVTEITEPDSTTGNDIGGFLIHASVSSGSGTGAVTLTATAGGTTTNVRGPGFVLRARATGVANQVYVATSANIAAGGEATTARLTAPSGKSTSDFVTGRRWDNENGTDTIDITVDDYTEVEWLVTTQSPAVDTDYFEFRVYAGGSALDTYTVTPKWTIGTSGVTGAATGLFGFSGTVNGIPDVAGVLTGPFGFTGTVAGVPNKSGVLTGAFGYTGTVTGTKVVAGTAVGDFGFTGTVIGTGSKTGTATSDFGFVATVAATPDVAGTISTSFGFAGTVNGTPDVTGTASGDFGFTGTVTVASGGSSVTGTGVGSFGFTGVAVGKRQKWEDYTHNFPGSSGYDSSFFNAPYGDVPTVGSNKMTFPAATSTYSGIQTSISKSLIGSYFLVQLDPRSTGGYSGFSVKDAGTNADILQISYRAQSGVLEGKYYGSNWSDTDSSSTPAFTATTVWFRASESSGIVYLDKYVAGSGWVTVHADTASASALTALANCKIELNCGPFGTAMTTGPSFANINIPPSDNPVGSSNFGFTATAVGTKEVAGTIATNFGFTATARTVGNDITGTAVGSFGFTARVLIPGGATQSMKVWNGSAWLNGVMKVYNGTSWVTGSPRVWDGTNWIPAGGSSGGTTGGETLMSVMLQSMTKPHEGTLDGVPSGYDWASGPRIGASQPATAAYINGWGEAYTSGGNIPANVHVEIRNLKCAILVDGTWSVVQSQLPEGTLQPEGAYFLANFAANESKSGTYIEDGVFKGTPHTTPEDGKIWNMHFWTTPRAAIPVGNVDAVACWFEARLAGTGDIANSHVLVGAGVDWYETATTGYLGDACIGHHAFLTGEWTTHLAHSRGLNIATNPPPVALPYNPGVWEFPFNTVKIMPLGDSITGFQATDSTGWTTMTSRLAAQGITITTVGSQTDGYGGLRHEGHGGWCLDNTANACFHPPSFQAGGINDNIVSWLNTYDPQIIVLNAGANDSFTGRETQLGDFLDTCLDLIHATKPNAYVLVARPKSWSDIPNDNAVDIGGRSAEQLDVVAAKQALGYNVRAFNAYTSFTGASTSDWRDYIHPSAQGVGKMMDNTYAAILQLVDLNAV